MRRELKDLLIFSDEKGTEGPFDILG